MKLKDFFSFISEMQPIFDIINDSAKIAINN